LLEYLLLLSILVYRDGHDTIYRLAGYSILNLGLVLWLGLILWLLAATRDVARGSTYQCACDDGCPVILLLNYYSLAIYPWGTQSCAIILTAIVGLSEAGL
jgi:hypothetical protein